MNKQCWVMYICCICTFLQVTVDQLASMTEIQTMANQVIIINATGDVSHCICLGLFLTRHVLFNCEIMMPKILALHNIVKIVHKSTYLQCIYILLWNNHKYFKINVNNIYSNAINKTTCPTCAKLITHHKSSICEACQNFSQDCQIKKKITCGTLLQYSYTLKSVKHNLPSKLDRLYLEITNAAQKNSTYPCRVP